MRSRKKESLSEMKDDRHPEGNGTITMTVKTCRNCGHVFVEGYYGSLGMQFWLSAFTLFGGIAYWALRGRGERCPRCKKRHFGTQDRTITVDVSGNNTRSCL